MSINCFMKREHFRSIPEVPILVGIVPIFMQVVVMFSIHAFPYV